MSSAVTKQQYSYSNEVKFSDLRRDFAESSSGSIPFSGYYRTTSLSNTNPVVPDATENTHVPTSSTISMSAFKNNTTVKRYYVTQSGTDSQLAIHGLSWNGNLDKNIIKEFRLTGVINSATRGVDAATVSQSNLTNWKCIISGQVKGAGGGGGGAGTNWNTIYGPASSVSPANRVRLTGGSGTSWTTIFDYGYTAGQNYVKFYQGVFTVFYGGVEIGTLTSNPLTSGSRRFYGGNLAVDNGNTWVTPSYYEVKVEESRNTHSGGTYTFTYNNSNVATTTEPTSSVVVGNKRYTVGSEYSYTGSAINYQIKVEELASNDGGEGSDALAIQCNNTNNIEINIESTGRLYGGGGGGGGGGTGATGLSGPCWIPRISTTSGNYTGSAYDPKPQNEWFSYWVRQGNFGTGGWSYCCDFRTDCFSSADAGDLSTNQAAQSINIRGTIHRTRGYSGPNFTGSGGYSKNPANTGSYPSIQPYGGGCKRSRFGTHWRGTKIRPAFYTVEDPVEKPGGAGGSGGAGGQGQGSNHNWANGVNGGSGTAGQCPNTGGAGTDGGTGGRGGDYAEAGTDGAAGANSGSGGAAGRAISREGTNASWTMTGSVNSTTLKGLYT